MELSPFSYFTDAVLRGPTIGSMLMCLSAAWIGVIIFLRKQSLIGEALSHAAYPGVILGVMVTGILSLHESEEWVLVLLILIGAFITALLGLITIHLLEKRYKIRSDSALCFVLSAFFGIGVTLASHIQFSHPGLYKQAQSYLYGQAATMNDLHIAIYGILACIVLAIVLLLKKEIQTMTFNVDYAKSLGIPVTFIHTLIFIVSVLAVVIGIRSVGVVLMSAMLIAPAVAARQFSNHLNHILWIAAAFGLLSGYLGNYFSVTLSHWLMQQYPDTRLALPTGPTIVIVAALICIASLLFAPERGLLHRMTRVFLFRHRCLRENILKMIWRNPNHTTTMPEMAHSLSFSKLHLYWILYQLKRNKWVTKTASGIYGLTDAGTIKAAHIVRLHRLWEVYLADYVGVGAERVHRNAEEMEHILTPELERALTLLLNDPKMDPHHQAIPPQTEST